MCGELIAVISLAFVEQAWEFLEVILLAELGWIFLSLEASSNSGLRWCSGNDLVPPIGAWGRVTNLGASESCPPGRGAVRTVVGPALCRSLWAPAQPRLASN